MYTEKDRKLSEIALAEQEISNWIHYWIEDNSVSDYLPKPNDNPKSDILEAAWLYNFPGDLSLIKTFPSYTEHDVSITSWINHQVSHAAWLTSWPVDSLGNKDEGARKLWQPQELRLIIDMDIGAIVLQQAWKNPMYISNVLLGRWEKKSPDWKKIVENAEKQKPFIFNLPQNLKTYKEFSEVRIGGKFIINTDDLNLASWKINFVLIKNNFIDTESSMSKLRLLH